MTPALPATSAAPDWKLPSSRKVGMICLILTESALFTIFVVAYLFYVGKSLNGPYPADVLELPILASVFLLSSSVTVALGDKAFRSGKVRAFQFWWLVTIAFGLVFLTATAVEWHHLITRERLTLGTNLFGTTFYSLVGLHASHVTVGLVLLILVTILSLLGKVAPEQHERVEMLSWYWHFVDAIWIVVFLVVYVIGR